MKRTREHKMVLVTAPDIRVARKLARAALEARAAACANLVPSLESHYRWKGKLETSSEVLVIFKTLRRLLPVLEATVRAVHPYDTPEFVVLPIESGSERYLAWVTESTARPEVAGIRG